MWLVEERTCVPAREIHAEDRPQRQSSPVNQYDSRVRPQDYSRGPNTRRLLATFAEGARAGRGKDRPRCGRMAGNPCGGDGRVSRRNDRIATANITRSRALRRWSAAQRRWGSRSTPRGSAASRRTAAPRPRRCRPGRGGMAGPRDPRCPSDRPEQPGPVSAAVYSPRSTVSRRPIPFALASKVNSPARIIFSYSENSSVCLANRAFCSAGIAACIRSAYLPSRP